jgi:GTP pyrophosphokinase
MEKIVIEAHDGLFEGTIRLRVHDVADIRTVTTALKRLKDVSSATRVN